MTREHMLNEIYRRTHRDFKGKHEGSKYILVNRDGATCLVQLSALTNEEIESKCRLYRLNADN